MIRNIWVGATSILWFASVAGAQPSSATWEPAARECLRAPTPSTAQTNTSQARAIGDWAPQPTCAFEDLKLRIGVGESVRIVDVSGRETRGRVLMLSDAILTVRVDDVHREFRAADVAQIDRRRRDPVWNGVLIGAAGGALLGFGLGRSLDSPSCPRSGIECGQGAVVATVSGAIWGAVGGWIADALIRKRDVVYVAAPAAAR